MSCGLHGDIGYVAIYIAPVNRVDRMITRVVSGPLDRNYLGQLR